MLAHSTGLSHLVTYQKGDALHAPFDDATFDVVWTQHAAMNIEDKRGLYREILRLLKPRAVSRSTISSPEQVRCSIRSHGRAAPISVSSFPSGTCRTHWLPKVFETSFRKTYRRRDSKRSGLSPGGPPPPASDPVLLRTEFPVMIANLIANLQGGACRVVHGTYTNK